MADLFGYFEIWLFWNVVQVPTFCGLMLLFLPELLACKTRATTEPSLSNTAGQPTRSRRVAGLVADTDLTPSRNIVKIENKGQLTYKNLNEKMIQNLRRRLNRGPSTTEFGAEVRQTSPGVSTPCRFLSGYRSIGRCTEVRSCRVGNIEYQNNVRHREGL